MVGEVNAQPMWMTMARFGPSARDMDVEHAHERILEGNPVCVARHADGIQRVVFRLAPGGESRGQQRSERL